MRHPGIDGLLKITQFNGQSGAIEIGSAFFRAANERINNQRKALMLRAGRFDDLQMVARNHGAEFVRKWLDG